jgi:hypothetical protein
MQSKISEEMAISIFLIVWNIFDVLVHVMNYMIELYRITGNIIGAIVAISALIKYIGDYRRHISIIGFFSIIIVNSFHAPLYGAEIAVAIFIGGSLFQIAKLAQIQYADDVKNTKYQKLVFSTWFAIAITILSQFIIFPVGSLNDSYGYQFMSVDQTDTTSELPVPQVSDGLLSAFFGLDNELPRRAMNFVPGAEGKDGMPVIFSEEVDLDSMQAGDFRVTTQSNETGYVHGVTLAPAIDEGELRTALLVGYYGSVEDPPILVEIVGNLYSIDRSVNFKGSSIDVIPLVDGPTLIFAEIVPESAWSVTIGRRPDRITFSGSGVPEMEDIRQVIRVAWAGGVELEDGREIDSSNLVHYTVTVEASNGSTREITPIAFGDLYDNDNNHLLCLDTDDLPISVAFQEGLLVDPNHDLNPETSIPITDTGGLAIATTGQVTTTGLVTIDKREETNHH